MKILPPSAYACATRLDRPNKEGRKSRKDFRRLNPTAIRLCSAARRSGKRCSWRCKPCSMLRAWEEYDEILHLLRCAHQAGLPAYFWTWTPSYKIDISPFRDDWALYARRLHDKGYGWHKYVVTLDHMPNSGLLHMHGVGIGGEFVPPSIRYDCGKPRRRGPNRDRVMGWVDIQAIKREDIANRANYVASAAWSFAEAHRTYSDHVHPVTRSHGLRRPA